MRKYEDKILPVKAKFTFSQMFHVKSEKVSQNFDCFHIILIKKNNLKDLKCQICTSNEKKSITFKTLYTLILCNSLESQNLDLLSHN